MGRESGGLIMKVVDLVMAVLTLIAALGGVFALLAPCVNPGSLWLFAYSGLASPIIYLANLFLTLYWVLRWKIIVILPAAVFLFGIPQIKLFYRLPSGKNTEETVEGGIKIMTYNVQGFLEHDPRNGRATSTTRDIVDFFRQEDPDVICIQEFQSTPRIPESTINEWMSGWPYRTIHYTIKQNDRGVWGSAIYSKFPILSHGQVHFEESRNGSLWVELQAGKNDTLRVICNHLETTYVDKKNREFLQFENFAGDPDRSQQIRQIAGRLRKGFRKRSQQADTIATLIASRDIPTLVCGDFNDPPMSYTYRTVRNGYGDAFVDKGEGYGYTYKHLYRLMRIDYVFHSPHFETLSYEAPDLPWSDHKPVIVTLKRN